MDNIKLEDTLYRKFQEETDKRKELILKLELILKTNENKDALRLLNEIQTSNRRLDTFMNLLTVGETRKNPVKKVAISAKPLTNSRFELEKVPKTPRTGDLIKKALLENEFTRHLDNIQIDEIVECMFEVKYNEDDLIITEGEVGGRVYVLQDGIVQVNKDGQALSTLGLGSVFGELAILFNCTRTVSIKALTRCRLWAIDREIFQQVMIKTGMDRLQKRTEFLRSVPEVRKLPAEAISEIANVLEEIHYENGDYIIRQGTFGDTFFILSKGQVLVTKTKDGSIEEEEIKHLQKGDFFGERALENENDVRTANVVVSDRKGADCLCIDRDTYQKLLRKVIADEDYEEDSYKSVNKFGDVFEFRGLASQLLFRQKSNPAPAVTAAGEFANIHLSDLTVLQTLGVGGIGRVELVKNNRDGKKYALKRMKKYFIQEMGQIEHIKNEKNLLMETNCDFIVRFHRTFKDETCIYMMMEACLGGELWTVLKNKKSFDDKAARFYTACAVEGFCYLHERGISYRDLKPENLVLEGSGPRKGYVKLIDFGCAKKVGHSKTWTFCGTPEYVAPEIIRNKGHDASVDLWSLGILIYELLTGSPPFSSSEPIQIYNMILKGIDALGYPKKMSKSAKDIIKKFCRDVPTDRLGYGKKGYRDIQKHRWYSGFNWDGLKKGTLRAPITPPGCDPYVDSEWESDPEDNPDENTEWDLHF